jgi:hypothetical protein
MAAATGAGGLMSGVEAQAVTDVVPADMEIIQRKNLDPKTRPHNQSIEDAIDVAIRESGRPGLPVAIQLNMTPDFTAGDLVFLYTSPASSEKVLHLTTVFTVHKVDPRDLNNITLSIYRIDASVKLDSVIAEYKKIGIYLTAAAWTGRLPSTTSWNAEPFTVSVNKTRCALVTKYESHPGQLVVVFGPSPPSAGSAGGAKRKRVISRKLKSLNKKRKYTHRRFRRRYSYKGGRKN